MEVVLRFGSFRSRRLFLFATLRAVIVVSTIVIIRRISASAVNHKTCSVLATWMVETMSGRPESTVRAPIPCLVVPFASFFSIIRSFVEERWFGTRRFSKNSKTPPEMIVTRDLEPTQAGSLLLLKQVGKVLRMSS